MQSELIGMFRKQVDFFNTNYNQTSNLRYIAIKSPLKNRVMHRKSKFVILIVWIISIALSSVQLFVGRVETVTFAVERTKGNSNGGIMYYVPLNQSHNNNSIFKYYERVVQYQCNENWNTETRQAYTLFNFFAVYLIPVFMLAYTYTCIAYIIKSTTHPGNADVYRDMHSNKSKRKVK